MAPLPLPAPGSAALFKSAASQAAYLAWYAATVDASPVPLESHQVATRHGATHVLLAGPADGPPLVLLHGWGGNAAGWVPDIAALADRFRVYAPDTIGQSGLSAAVRLPYGGPGYAEWLCDVLDGLGLARPFLLGVSGGGWLILKLGAHAPDRVARAVLLSPAGLAPTRLSLGGILNTAPLMLRPSPAAGRRFVRYITGPGASVDPADEEGFFLLFRHFRTATLGQLPVLPDADVRRLAAPTLLLVGEHEVFFNPVAALRRARALLPDVQAEVLAGAGHAMTVERRSEVVARVRAFLDLPA